MRAMKDSGVEWIGEIPDGWNVVRFKYAHLKTNVGIAVDKDFWSSDKSDTVFYTAGLNPINTSFKDFSQEILTTEDDLLLARNGTPYVYLPETGALYTDHIIRVKIKSGFSKTFIRYCLQQSIAAEIVETVSIATWSVPIWDRQLLPLPPPAEQQRIAAYLDEQCGEIDKVLAKTRESIEEYKKLKQSVITEAVTKGIRPDRPMKPSGIEWIGDIPTEWEVCRIKNVIFPQQRPVCDDDEIITCFRDGEVTLRKNRREDGFTISFTEHGYQGVEVGDLVIHGMDAFAGAIGCSDSKGKTSPVVHVCKTVGNNRFFMYFLRSMAFGDILMDLSNGVRIRSSDFRNFSKLGVFGAIIPDIAEQNEIVDYLDARCAEVDHLITKKEQIITELEGYKKSLIYECVTGKREVE